eukprot:8805646-Pyramimonas_sp.AAC.1
MKGTMQLTSFPPRSRGIAGRIAMTKFRIRARTVALFPEYMPPKGTTPSLLKEAADTSMTWFNKTADKLGHQCFIIMGGDLNSPLGIRRDAIGRKYYRAGHTVGIKSSGMEAAVSQSVRDALEENHLTYASIYGIWDQHISAAPPAAGSI